MSRSQWTTPVLTVIVGLLAAAQVSAVGPEAQRIVADKAIEALPEPLRAFLAERRDRVLERCVEPGGAWLRDPAYAGRAEWQYLWLDAAAADQTLEARLRAAREFPRDRADARKLFRERGIQAGGELPWELAECVDKLAAAFTAGKEAEIVACSGYVCHFAAQAADPFRTTRNDRGQESGNLILGRLRMGDRLFAHQDVGQRLGWEMARRYADRYRSTIDSSKMQCVATESVLELVLGRMATALAGVDDLCRADAQVVQNMQLADGPALLARLDEFYELLDESCGRQCVDNLRRGAELAASLVLTAWRQAGSPTLPGTALGGSALGGAGAGGSAPGGSAASAGGAGAHGGSQVAAPAGGFVGSKNSKVYHRPNCSHVARIAADNLLRFATQQEAEATGRQPCKKCQPASG